MRHGHEQPRTHGDEPTAGLAPADGTPVWPGLQGAHPRGGVRPARWAVGAAQGCRVSWGPRVGLSKVSRGERGRNARPCMAVALFESVRGRTVRWNEAAGGFVELQVWPGEKRRDLTLLSFFFFF